MADRMETTRMLSEWLRDLLAHLTRPITVDGDDRTLANLPIAVSECGGCPFFDGVGWLCDLKQPAPQSVRGFTLPPPWCPLRAGPQVVMLTSASAGSVDGKGGA